MTTEKPREIVVRGVDMGPAGNESPGLRARDTRTGAVLALPKPVKRNGNVVEGREAAAHVASLLLLAQGGGGRPSWERDTTNAYVFTVFDA
jgi:hypothetical protein